MKKQEWQKLKNNSPVEIQQKLADFYGQLRKLKFDLARGKVKNIKEIKETKKIIARILTTLRQDQGKK